MKTLKQKVLLSFFATSLFLTPASAYSWGITGSTATEQYDNSGNPQTSEETERALREIATETGNKIVDSFDPLGGYTRKVIIEKAIPWTAEKTKEGGNTYGTGSTTRDNYNNSDIHWFGK